MTATNKLPLDRQIEMQIFKVDRLQNQIDRCRKNRETRLDSLATIYEQLAAAKAELAELQLQEINNERQPKRDEITNEKHI